jgi:VWFA-related protein
MGRWAVSRRPSSKNVALRVIVVVALAVLLPRSAAQAPPRESGLVEKTTTRLAQIDISVSGPEEIVSKLEPQDFEVWVGGRQLSDFFLDASCLEESATPPPPPVAAGSLAPPVPAPARPRGTTYLFYFDQSHLTQGGRQIAIDLARELVEKLVVDGSRAMIISNAQELVTLAPLTSDRRQLQEVLVKLEDDAKQWDPYPTQEDTRVSEIQNAIGQEIDRAISLARIYQSEERWRQEKALRRLSMVLGTFASFDPPKAVLYFADTMRQNAGAHYLGFFGQTVLDAQGSAIAAPVAGDSATGALPLDRVINEASANGIRFYTIEAQGLTSPGISAASRSSARTLSNAATPGMNSARVRDAQSTLASLAAETGGQAFLNGVGSGKIAERILQDLGCLYLLSFDPADFPEDRPLPVRVTVHKPRVKVQTRGRIVLQSASTKLTSRLLAAFASPEATVNDTQVRIGVVPIGYKDGSFAALVQVAVPGTPLAEATWDLGASVLTAGQVREDGSGRVTVNAARVPVVFEKEMRFRPGPYQIVAVAHESTSNLIASLEEEGGWPDLEAATAAVGPIAILKPAKGVFLRDGAVRKSGTLAVGDTDPAREDVPLAVVGLVCRSKDQKGSLEVERRIIGETEASFPPMELDLGADRCAQFRDLVPPKSMGPGEYRFEVRVLRAGVEIARKERAFIVNGPTR